MLRCVRENRELDYIAAADLMGPSTKRSGAKRRLESERMVFWSAGRGTAQLAVITPYDKKSATPGNGTMVSLNVDTPAKVDAVHKKALQLGGKDEGAPGARTDTFYGAYFRDLDGNKLAVFCMTPKAG